MPPMMVVVPSLTCTRVIARCVLIDGLPSTATPALPFSTLICMMTVFAAVICGVTRSVRAASL